MSDLSEIGWADLVLSDIPAPVDATNEQNLINWMTNEEPASQWWGGYGTASAPTRLNPLNTGVGTGGGSGLGSAPDLTTAAYDTASTIDQSNMAAIKAALEASAPAATFGQAVISSPWAGSHYGYDVNRFTGADTPGPDVTSPSAIGSAATIPAGQPLTAAQQAQLTSTLGNIGNAAIGAIPGAGPALGLLGGAASGALGGSLTADIGTVLLVAAGLGLVVLGAFKTANPGRSITQTATNTAGSALGAAALA